jgi:hypothetical protein
MRYCDEAKASATMRENVHCVKVGPMSLFHKLTNAQPNHPRNTNINNARKSTWKKSQYDTLPQPHVYATRKQGIAVFAVKRKERLSNPSLKSNETANKYFKT